MRPLAVLVTLLALVVSGCTFPTSSDVGAAAEDTVEPAVHDVVREHVLVESFDGTALDNWVYRPDSSEPVAVIINFSPYWTNFGGDPSEGGDAFSQYLIDFFIPRGYAVVLSSVRGTGYSEGCFTIGGESERKDAVAVIEHFAAAPWSNGAVAAAGKSYDGTVPQAALVEAPEALKTIVPVSAISEFYKYNSVNGLSYDHGWRFNQYYYAGVGMDVYSSPKTDRPDLIVQDAACPELPAVQAHGLASGITGDYTAYWQERNYSALAANAKASVFYVHGLADWNVKPDHMTPWLEDLAAAGVTTKLWLGQWGHEYPTRDDFNATLLAWFDHYLLGKDTGILDAPLVQVQDNQGVWRHEDAWPPARVTERRYHPTADGTLADAPAEGTITLQDTAPQAIAAAGPAFETPPLTETLRYAGTPVLTVEVAHSTPQGQLTWVLYDVAPNGTATPLNFGYHSYAHRDGLESGTPVTPGEPFTLAIPGYPQDDAIPAGHALRLEVTPQAQWEWTWENGPRVWTRPSGGVTTWDLSKSAFALPVLPNAGLRVEDPQPVDVGCWAC